MCGKPRCNLGRNVPPSRLNSPDYGQQFALRHALQNVTSSSGPQCTIDLGVAVRTGQHDDKCIWKLFPNCNEGVSAIYSGKSNIHQGDIRPMNAEFRDGLFSICRLGDKNHVLLRTNDHREALANKWMILNAKNTNWIADGHSSLFTSRLLSFSSHPLAYISRAVDDLRS